LNFFKQFFLPSCARLKEHYLPVSLPVKDEVLFCEVSNTLKISIVIPSFNQAQFIEHTLRSLQRQNYSTLEVVVVDGGSTDSTVEILDRYNDFIDYWISEPDKGQADAINKGMKLATGDILAWLNSDDILLPNALHEVANYFHKSCDVDVVYGHRVLCNEEGQDIGKWIIAQHSGLSTSYADFVPQETMFWRRAIWEKVGSALDDSFQFALDWELIMRFSRANAKFVRIPYFLGGFRLHEEQKTQANIEEVGFKEMELVRNIHLDEIGKFGVSRKVYLVVKKVSFIVFLLRSRAVELLWKLGIIKIG